MIFAKQRGTKRRNDGVEEKEEEEAVVIQVEEVRKVKDDKPTRNGYLPFLAASFFLKHKQPTLLLNPMTYIANVR